MDHRIGERSARKSATTNLVRTSVTLLSGLALQPLLLRNLSVGGYVAITIATQVGSMFAYLDLGVRITVTRLIAGSFARKEYTEMRATLSRALALELCIAALGAIALVLVAISMPQIYPHIEEGQRLTSRIVLLAVGAAMLLTIITSGYSAFVIASQQVQRTMRASIVVRLAVVASIAFAAAIWHNPLLVGLATASGLAFQALVDVWIARSMLPSARPPMEGPRFPAVLALGRSSAPASTTTIGLLLIAGFDLAVVGRVDAAHLASYAPVVALFAVLFSLHQAVFAPLLPSLSESAATGTTGDLARRTVRVIETNTAVWTITVALGLYGLPEFLHLWLGGKLAPLGMDIARILLITTFVRYVSWPMNVAALASGRFRKVMFLPLIEGAANLTASIVLGIRLGAIGVAIGSLVGAVIGVGLAMRKISDELSAGLHRGPYLRKAVAWPALVLAGPILVSFASRNIAPGPFRLAVAFPLTVLALLAVAIHNKDEIRGVRRPRAAISDVSTTECASIRH